MVISNILPSLDTGPINLLSAYFNILFNKNTFRQEYLGKWTRWKMTEIMREDNNAYERERRRW
jgi:hypothetical protein